MGVQMKKSIEWEHLIDWPHLKELKTELGESVFCDVVMLFLDDVGVGINGLARHQDASDLQAQLHSLKGNALSLGFTNLAQQCAKSEELAVKGQHCQKELNKLSACFDESKTALISCFPVEFIQ
jgi:HPt (histidine-containing phosphotransfer) domain-containing protein